MEPAHAAALLANSARGVGRTALACWRGWPRCAGGVAVVNRKAAPAHG
jgi:hypothetical protein